jgi:PAS domain-containing protein
MWGGVTTKYSGLGERILSRLRSLGYWKKNRVDVLRFCREKGYRPQYVYAWAKDRVPSYENLKRLASDLDVPMAWILFGRAAGSVSPAELERLEPAGRERARARGEAAGLPRRPAPAEGSAPLAPPAGAGVPVLEFKQIRDLAERLVSLETESHAILGAFSDGYFWLDAEGTILASRIGSDFGGALPPGPLVGKRMPELLGRDLAERLSDGLRSAVSSNIMVALEWGVPAREGARWYECRFIPLPGSPERLRLLAIVRDISEGERVEETRSPGLGGEGPPG